MNLIHEFYNNLDLLELIIFWGIILIIFLTIILIIIIINKKKKQTKEFNQISSEYVEELPILTAKTSEQEYNENYVDDSNDTIFSINEEKNILEEIEPIIEINEKIDVEDKEEPIKINQNKYQTTFEMPSAPYQKNVLREMSLSQTSPIGINRKDDSEIKQEVSSLSNSNVEELELNNENEEIAVYKAEQINYQQPEREKQKYERKIEQRVFLEEEPIIEELNQEIIEMQEHNEIDNFDIERTQYEIEQEENAIISYKELMEKKDSIQTIDEEDAIISIEELLNKTNLKEECKEETKLYNISESEENDSFINELKQFRKDL